MLKNLINDFFGAFVLMRGNRKLRSKADVLRKTPY